MTVLALVGTLFSMTLTSANAAVDTQVAAPSGTISTFANKVPCSADVLSIRYDPLDVGSWETHCWANAGLVEGGKTFWDTIRICTGNNDVDYSVNNIRSTIWRWTCRDIWEGADISQVYIR